MMVHPRINNAMDEQWEMIFSATALYRAEMLKSLLLEENIPAVVVNKQDSAYIFIGEAEVYIKREDVLKAKQIVNRFLSSE
jgi:hypothetical protein